MGKKTRRKQRHGQDETQEQQAPPPSSTAAGPIILQRIRHADIAIRQAALAGVLHAQLLHKKNSSKLLQAVREQYMGENICAIAAADCLVDYLEYADNVDEQFTAGWLPLVVERLRHDQTTLRLIQGSLQMLVLLIEDNPVAVNRLINNPDLRDSCLQSIMVWLDDTIIRTREQNSGLSDENECKQMRTSIHTLAARCLDSLFQDNSILVEPLFSSPTTEPMAIIRNMQAFFSETPYTMMAQLHIISAWLSAWTVCKSCVDDARILPVLEALESQLDTCTLILGKVIQGAFIENHRHSTYDYETLQQAYGEWQAEVVDQELDREIIRKVDTRREPARQIVKRKALLKQQRKQQQQSTDDMDMEDDNNEEDDHNDDNRPALDHRDKEQIWNDLYDNFLSQFVRPVSLAVEIVSNMLLPLDDEEGDVIMDETATMHPLLQSHVEKLSLVVHVKELLKRLADTSLERMESNTLPPLPIQRSLGAVASKAGTCLMNAFRHSNFLATIQLWKYLYHCLNVYPESGISHAMVACVQRASNDGMNMGDDDDDEVVQFLLNWIQTKPTAAAVSTTLEEYNLILRDVICMLGLVGCSWQSDARLRDIASLLVSTSTIDDSLPIRAERANVLMDLFSDDDRHAVFVELSLLGFFQRELPILQRQVSLYRGGDGEDGFQEVATNAGRFIQYKKGNL